jgi:hypothetical protein
MHLSCTRFPCRARRFGLGVASTPRVQRDGRTHYLLVVVSISIWPFFFHFLSFVRVVFLNDRENKGRSWSSRVWIKGQERRVTHVDQRNSKHLLPPRWFLSRPWRGLWQKFLASTVLFSSYQCDTCHAHSFIFSISNPWRRKCSQGIRTMRHRCLGQHLLS